jgi:hypothetical protein
MSKPSRYAPYWEILLSTGKLVIQVPTPVVASIKRAIVKRKYHHHLRTGIKHNDLSIVASAAVDTKGNFKMGYTRLTFTLIKVKLEDI